MFTRKEERDGAAPGEHFGRVALTDFTLLVNQRNPSDTDKVPKQTDQNDRLETRRRQNDTQDIPLVDLLAVLLVDHSKTLEEGLAPFGIFRKVQELP